MRRLDFAADRDRGLQALRDVDVVPLADPDVVERVSGVDRPHEIDRQDFAIPEDDRVLEIGHVDIDAVEEADAAGAGHRVEVRKAGLVGDLVDAGAAARSGDRRRFAGDLADRDAHHGVLDVLFQSLADHLGALGDREVAELDLSQKREADGAVGADARDHAQIVVAVDADFDLVSGVHAVHGLVLARDLLQALPLALGARGVPPRLFEDRAVVRGLRRERGVAVVVLEPARIASADGREGRKRGERRATRSAPHVFASISLRTLRGLSPSATAIAGLFAACT